MPVGRFAKVQEETGTKGKTMETVGCGIHTWISASQALEALCAFFVNHREDVFSNETFVNALYKLACQAKQYQMERKVQADQAALDKLRANVRDKKFDPLEEIPF